jgi:hypothetical protein
MHDDLSQDPIPYAWTADQALTVVEFLEDLAELIWSRYGFTIRGCSLEPDPPAETPQLALPFPPLWECRTGRDADRPDDWEPW